MENLQAYDDFVKATRIRTNFILNRILWYFLVTGPAVALGIKFGLFAEIKYQSCVVISFIILMLATIHLILCQKNPASKVTSLFALISLNLLIVYMANSHLGIYLTYCLVPTLSLLFCDRKIFFCASAFNYVAMGIAAFMISPFFSSHSTLYPESKLWFINIFGGYTIEAIIMFLAGSAVCKFSTDNLKKLYEDQHQLKNNEKQISDQLDILKSMSEIYQTLNLVDLEHGVVSALNDQDKMEKFSIEKGTRSWSNRKILETILLDHKKKFADFTDLSTLHERIKGKKSITLEVQDSISGWLRCQYISLGEDVYGHINKVIYAVENVVEEKRREEKLIQISNTDELTGLYNRRAYENTIKKYYEGNLEEDFVIFSIDINELKQTNDKLGHDAGDNLIQGASTCLLKVFGTIGKIYRVGGDEFAVLLHQSEGIFNLKQKLIDEAKNWHGVLVKSIEFSIGYACKSDYPSSSFKELEHKADQMMYHDKEIFYSNRGTDRRGMNLAFNTLRDTYIKILKINFVNNLYKPLKLDDEEKTAESGYSELLTEWLQNFGNAGFVHPEDLPNYLEKTDIKYLREYFAPQKTGEKQTFKLFYRRKDGTEYRKVLMEIKPAEEEILFGNYFLFVKNIDE